MKFHILTTFFLVVILLSACSHEQTKELRIDSHALTSLSLNGDWEFHPSGSLNDLSEWSNIKVPANWYKQGFDIHGKAYYKKQLFADNSLQNKQLNLVFNGVDYITDVWVNGQHIGTHEGYFQKFNFDISKAIKINQQNEILVRVDSPHEKPNDFSLRKRLIKGIFSHHDTRPGGAWSKRGQERNTGGIWGAVELHISDQVYAKQLKAIPAYINDKQWQLKTNVKLQGDLPKGAVVEWDLKPKNHQSASFSGTSDSKRFSIDVVDPALWWPTGFGKANLYKLSARIIHGNKILEKIESTVAFRRVELDKNKIWKINGQRIFLRGTNYIASQWLSEMNRDKFAKDIQLMKDANINTVRVHAHITAPEFYQLCDEQGLMIWQDFPLQWGYQDTVELHQQALSQLEDMIEQYANHPSIIHWTLHNEPPWDADWMKWKYPDYLPTQNKILDEKLFKRAKQLEKSRPITMVSSTKEHPWLGWYSGHWLDYAKPTDQAFIAEFGAQALPKKSVLKKILQGDIALPPISESEKKQEWKSWEEWKYHNFQPRESFEIANIDTAKNTKELIKNTQHYQAQLIQLAAESYRRQAYKPVSSIFQFMFVEDWESMSWGVVDYWRNTKLGYDSLRTAYQPILPSLEWSKVEYPKGVVEIGLWVLNDSNNDYQHVRYEVELLNDNTSIDKHVITVEINADQHEKMQIYRTPVLASGDYVLQARLIDQNNKVLGKNRYAFSVKNK